MVKILGTHDNSRGIIKTTIISPPLKITTKIFMAVAIVVELSADIDEKTLPRSFE